MGNCRRNGELGVSKIIESPVRHFPGTVTIADPLNFSQWVAWRAALDNASLEREKAVEAVGGEEKPPMTYGEIGLDDACAVAAIPGICACVERWELANFPEAVTPETFPATPRWRIAALLVWLTREIDAVAFRGGSDPNE